MTNQAENTKDNGRTEPGDTHETVRRRIRETVRETFPKILGIIWRWAKTAEWVYDESREEAQQQIARVLAMLSSSDLCLVLEYNIALETLVNASGDVDPLEDDEEQSTWYTLQAIADGHARLEPDDEGGFFIHHPDHVEA